jgi:hypothetical protein
MQATLARLAIRLLQSVLIHPLHRGLRLAALSENSQSPRAARAE